MGRVTGLLAMGAFVFTACILTSQSVPMDHRRLAWLDVTVHKFGSVETSSCFNDATTCDGYFRYNEASKDKSHKDFFRIMLLDGCNVTKVAFELNTMTSVEATDDNLLTFLDESEGVSIKVGGLDKE